MKTTTLEKPVTRYGVATRRDEAICANFCAAALAGMLSTNSFYDADSFAFRDGLDAEELLDKAHDYGVAAFENWKRWRKHYRAVAALKNNPKVVVK